MSFGTKIKELRRQKNITQEKLAEYLNISPQAISRWETDNAFPDISLLAPICNIFDITSDELLDINVKNKEAELKKYNDSFIKWASDISKTEEIRQNTIITLRQGVRLYPDQLLLKKQLVTVLYVNSENEPNLDEKIEMCN